MVSNHVWQCSYELTWSHWWHETIPDVKCENNKITLNGDTVTWVTTGNTGTISQSGNTINWNGGSSWEKLGMNNVNIKYTVFRNTLLYPIIK